MKLPLVAAVAPCGHHWLDVGGPATHYGGSVYTEEHCVHCGVHRQLERKDAYAMGGEDREELVNVVEHYTPSCDQRHWLCTECGTA